jgi:hypothetical protein
MAGGKIYIDFEGEGGEGRGAGQSGGQHINTVRSESTREARCWREPEIELTV